MEFKHDTSWQKFEEIFNSKLPLKDGWNKLIDYHQNIKQKPYWTQLRAIDFEKEIADTKEWLEETIQENALPPETVALWVGLTKFVDEAENELYAMYLAGSDSYSKDDIEWAAEPIYNPESSYVLFETLNKIDALIKTDEDYDFLDWILPISFSALLIDYVIRTNLNKKIILKHSKKLFVSVGHNGGDFMCLTPIK